MKLHALVLLAAPLSCLAQIPGTTTPPAIQTAAGPTAPAQVEQALRARVNAFLEYQRKGDFRKAYDLVAEDSKDFYFGAPKEKSTSFTIDEIRYSADLSSATVRSTVRRQMMLAGHPVDVPQLLISDWKLEKADWVWYHDPSKDVVKTILGEVPVAPADATTESPLPKDLGQKAALAAAAKISNRAAIDKKVVSFTMGKEATEEVTFHNGNPGQIKVLVEVSGVADTITAEPNNSMLNPEADLKVKLTYKPLKESATRGVVRFILEPFGSVYVLPVRIARERSAQTPPAQATAPAVP